MTAADDASLTGLTEKQAQERLSEDGYNELPASKKRGPGTSSGTWSANPCSCC